MPASSVLLQVDGVERAVAAVTARQCHVTSLTPRPETRAAHSLPGTLTGRSHTEVIHRGGPVSSPDIFLLVSVRNVPLQVLSKITAFAHRTFLFLLIQMDFLLVQLQATYSNTGLLACHTSKLLKVMLIK